MNKKKIIAILTGGALTLATVFGVATYRVVNAQASTPTPGAPSNSGQPGFDHGMRGGVSDEALATALGISADQLQAAQKTATDEALQQAVADGLITQDRADQFAQNEANGQPYGRMPFLNGGSIDYNALLAKALGISTDDLQAATQKAYFASLDQTVREHDPGAGRRGQGELRLVERCQLPGEHEIRLRGSRPAGSNGRSDHPGPG